MSKQKKFKLTATNTTIIVALVTSVMTFCGTAITAVLASPLIIGWFEEPVAAQEIQLPASNGSSQTTQITLVSDDHFVTRRDLLTLDQNDFVVNEDLEVAVKKKESGFWEIDTYDRILSVSIADVPMFGLGMSAFGNVYAPKQYAIFGVRQTEGHEIFLSEDSVISSVPMNLNLYADIEFVKASLEASSKMMTSMDPLQAQAFEQLLQDDEFLRKTQTELSESFNAYLRKQLPVTKQLHNGVYVMPITRDDLEGGLYSGLIPASTLLDKAMNYLNFSGIYSSGSIQNISINQEKGIASFNSSVELENVKIDGKFTNAILNNIGFVVAGEERAILVILVFLDVDDPTVLTELRSILDSLRFTK